MAELTRTFKWEKFVPDLGDNRNLEKPFFFEVASGLSKLEFKEAMGIWSQLAGTEADMCAKAAASLAPYVRLGSEPLSVSGQPITTLEAYLALTIEQPSMSGWMELAMAIKYLNSLDGTRELFFARPFGGFTFTPQKK